MENARKLNENEPINFENEIKFIKPKFDGETGLREILLKELKLMYYVEKVVSKAFPKIIKNSCNFELIEAIYIHQADTQKQLFRIEESFEILKVNAILNRCQAIELMISEVDNVIEVTKFGMIRDAGIILSLHKIEHYEIASYSILSVYAENLKENRLLELFDKSLNEEKVAQMRLAKIANTIQFNSEDTKP
jgi:ferritin-like metal-binding protein YciE